MAFIFRFRQQQLNSDMTVDNMGNQVSVCAEKFQVTPAGQGSLTSTQHHVAIPIEELSASLHKDAKDNYKKPVPNAKDKIPEEQQGDQKTEEKGECRYCQEEEFVSKLETPCNCSGSLKYAHRRCIAHWCNTKRNTICEICKQQPYCPNYSVTAPPRDDDDDIVMSERWRIPGTNTRILSPTQLAERFINRLLRSMNSDFTLRNPTGGVIFGTALLVFLGLLVIRDACYYTPPKEDKFSHILYIAVVIIIAPIYILSWISECRAHREHHSARERNPIA